MDNTIAKQNQFPFLSRPIHNNFFSQFVSAYPYLLNTPYLNSFNTANTSWLQQANSAGCPSPISPSNNNVSGRCPICMMSMQGVDANQHFIDEVQRLEAYRKTKETEDKCKMDIIDVDIENRDEQSILSQLIRRNSRFTSRYQTYLKIKHNRELRKIRSYRNQKRQQDEKNINSLTPPGLGSLTSHQLNQLNQFNLSAAAHNNLQNNLHNNLQNNLHLLHQQSAAAQHLANQAHQQHANNQTSNASSLLINGLLLNAVAAASCNSPVTSNSNVTSCLDNVDSNLGLSNGGHNNTNNTNLGNPLTNSLTNSLGNSQSNGISQDRTTPGSTSSTPLTNLSSINGLNGNLNNTNGNTSPTSTATNSPVTQLNGSNNVIATHQNTKQTSPNGNIWSIASITGLNAVANNLQNFNNLNNLNNNLNNELKRRCLTDDEDEDLEITDDRDSISSDK